MILFLVGLVCFLAALRVTRDEASVGDDVRGAGAVAWFAVVALLTLVQLWGGRDELDGYRMTLLGFRYRVSDEAGRPAGSPLTVSGSYDDADLWVPGAGETPAATLAATGDDLLSAVEAHPVADANAVTLLEERGFLSSGWRLLGSVPVTVRDTVVVQGRGETYRLVSGTVPATRSVAGLSVPIPWVRLHRLREVGTAGRPGAGSALLPAVEQGAFRGLVPSRPSLFQRTYPLADILHAVDSTTAASLPALTSFLYYRKGELRLADLDAEVEVTGPSAGAGTAGGPVTVWSPDRGGRRLLVAGLAHRDYPEPDLTLPERYGVRPLRSFHLTVHGAVVGEGAPLADAWLDASLASPEVRHLDPATLDELRLPGGSGPDGRGIMRVRLTPGRNALARQSVVFDAAPGAFAVPGQAVFRLPEEPTDGRVGVLTPSGLAEWSTGRPLTLGVGDRALLMRVDGQGTSAGFWLVLVGLYVMAGLVFVRRPMNGAVFALALTATGLVSLRLVLGLSALARFPFVQEAQQIGLWLVPLLPWAVVLAGEAVRGGPGSDPPDAATPSTRSGPDLRAPALRGWLFHGVYALVLVALGVALFQGSRPKQAVLSAVPVGLVALAWAARSGRVPWRAWSARVRAWAGRRPWAVNGWVLGAALLALRAAMELLGFREQITVGGTRIGVSVLYTPLALGLLALLLVVRDRAIRREGASARVVAASLVEIGGFLLLAYVGVSGWISDFGIALVLLPGVLTLVALLGYRWAVPGRRGVLTASAMAFPLLLFVLLQAAPPLLRPAWGPDLASADVRMGEWNRNELLLLERGDPAALRMIGQRRSEALAVMRETMRSYTRGNAAGKGFLQGRVSDEISETSTREHTVSALLASQFGLGGTAGLVLLLLALLPPASERLRLGGGAPPDLGRLGVLHGGGLAVLVTSAYVLPAPFNALVVGLLVVVAVTVLAGPALPALRPALSGMWGGPSAGEAGGAGLPADLPARRLVAALAVFTVAFAGLYMVLANYGLTFFTGKNVFLLGLDSLGDTLETLVLLSVAAAALGMEATGDRAREGGAGEGTALAPLEGEWWHPSDGEDEHHGRRT